MKDADLLSVRSIPYPVPAAQPLHSNMQTCTPVVTSLDCLATWPKHAPLLKTWSMLYLDSSSDPAYIQTDCYNALNSKQTLLVLLLDHLASISWRYTTVTSRGESHRLAGSGTSVLLRFADGAKASLRWGSMPASLALHCRTETLVTHGICNSRDPSMQQHHHLDTDTNFVLRPAICGSLILLAMRRILCVHDQQCWHQNKSAIVHVIYLNPSGVGSLIELCTHCQNRPIQGLMLSIAQWSHSAESLQFCQLPLHRQVCS